ncbi:hypothetical protein JCM17846_28190 [Iodidimonas nitroreducens]|uniref:Uncharacterized protein n=2 Tax=Iodidimonas nitroreducens TaxID=1236968 RepID=A0A5A7NB41_9PROT|nr:hypothetical protein JCM17846_28190 [Iodidimonas nitroreducens]
MFLKLSDMPRTIYLLLTCLFFFHFNGSAFSQNNVDELIGSYQTRYIFGEHEENDVLIIHYNKKDEIEVIWKNFIDNEKLYHLNPFYDLRLEGDKVFFKIKTTTTSPMHPEPKIGFIQFEGKREGDEIYGVTLYPPNSKPREAGSIYMKKISE